MNYAELIEKLRNDSRLEILDWDNLPIAASAIEALQARVKELEGQAGGFANETLRLTTERDAALAKLVELEKQAPVAWTLTEELTKRETTTRAHLWFTNPVNCMWSPLYASPVPAKTLTYALEMTRTALIEHGSPFLHHELRYQEAIELANEALKGGA